MLRVEPVNELKREAIECIGLEGAREVLPISNIDRVVARKDRVFPYNIDLATRHKHPAVYEVNCESIIIDVVG